MTRKLAFRESSSLSSFRIHTRRDVPARYSWWRDIMFVGGSKLPVLLGPALRSVSCWLQVRAPSWNGDRRSGQRENDI